MSQVFYYPDLISTPWLCTVVAANQFISSLVNCEIKLVYIYLVDPIVWLRQTTLLFAGLWQCVWLARIWCGWRTSRLIKASLQEAWIPPFPYLFKRMTSTSTVYKIHMTSTITVWFKSDLPVTPIFWWLSLSSTKYMYRISSLFAWHKICENAFVICISRFWWF